MHNIFLALSCDTCSAVIVCPVDAQVYYYYWGVGSLVKVGNWGGGGGGNEHIKPYVKRQLTSQCPRECLSQCPSQYLSQGLSRCFSQCLSQCPANSLANAQQMLSQCLKGAPHAASMLKCGATLTAGLLRQCPLLIVCQFSPLRACEGGKLTHVRAGSRNLK